MKQSNIVINQSSQSITGEYCITYYNNLTFENKKLYRDQLIDNISIYQQDLEEHDFEALIMYMSVDAIFHQEIDLFIQLANYMPATQIIIFLEKQILDRILTVEQIMELFHTAHSKCSKELTKVLYNLQLPANENKNIGQLAYIKYLLKSNSYNDTIAIEICGMESSIRDQIIQLAKQNVLSDIPNINTIIASFPTSNDVNAFYNLLELPLPNFDLIKQFLNKYKFPLIVINAFKALSLTIMRNDLTEIFELMLSIIHNIKHPCLDLSIKNFISLYIYEPYFNNYEIILNYYSLSDLITLQKTVPETNAVNKLHMELKIINYLLRLEQYDMVVTFISDSKVFLVKDDSFKALNILFNCSLFRETYKYIPQLYRYLFQNQNNNQIKSDIMYLVEQLIGQKHQDYLPVYRSVISFIHILGTETWKDPKILKLLTSADLDYNQLFGDLLLYYVKNIQTPEVYDTGNIFIAVWLAQINYSPKINLLSNAKLVLNEIVRNNQRNLIPNLISLLEESINLAELFSELLRIDSIDNIFENINLILSYKNTVEVVPLLHTAIGNTSYFKGIENVQQLFNIIIPKVRDNYRKLFQFQTVLQYQDEVILLALSYLNSSQIVQLCIDNLNAPLQSKYEFANQYVAQYLSARLNELLNVKCYPITMVTNITKYFSQADQQLTLKLSVSEQNLINRINNETNDFNLPAELATIENEIIKKICRAVGKICSVLDYISLY